MLARLGAWWCLAEVFILMGLHGARFVNVVDARVTDASLAKFGENWKNGVDSIGFAKWCAVFCGSADSAGVAGFCGARLETERLGIEVWKS